jgi:hypothetical protein
VLARAVELYPDDPVSRQNFDAARALVTPPQ